MRIKKLLNSFMGSVLAVFAVPLLAFTPIASAATTVVTPTNLSGWEISNFDADDSSTDDSTTDSGTDGNFVNGPGTPPAGTGSFNQVVGTNGDDAQRLRTNNFNGTPIGQLTNLSYSTYVTTFGSGGQATYIQLFVDQDGDGDFDPDASDDDILFFEPVYQNGTYGTLGYSTGSIPNQCGVDPLCVVLNSWQTWDADAGGWWSLKDSAGGPPLTTLAAYAAEYPDAVLANTTPALRLTAGFGGAAWANFNGNVDNLTVNNTTYDFELTNPTPPTTSPVTKDDCKKDKWKALTDLDGKSFKNQGDCVSWVATQGRNGPNGTTVTVLSPTF